jgi:recombination protein RecA
MRAGATRLNSIGEAMGLEDDIIKEIGVNDSNQDVSDWLSTGVLPLNKIMSGKYRGGFPVGRVTEIYGGESSGKTLMATMAMKETQKRDGVAALLDFEHAFSLSRAEELGLITDPAHWIYKQPTTAEEGFSIAEKICNLVRKHGSDRHVTLVFDSIASMVTKAELEAGFEDGNMKTRLSLPVLMSTSLKMLSGIISRTNVTAIFLNQTRDNPGIMFGDKESQPGGKAMKFYASLRIRLGKSGKIKDGDNITGEEVVAKTIKNKVFRPFLDCSYHSSFSKGIDLPTTHILALAGMGLMGDSKGFYAFEEKKYRLKDLVALMNEDAEAYERLLSMFVDEEKP